tara:strand:+ start:8693 stop:9559 length:867 start_codon:yes stop_codon:yes gene_type:complete
MVKKQRMNKRSRRLNKRSRRSGNKKSRRLNKRSRRLNKRSRRIKSTNNKRSKRSKKSSKLPKIFVINLRRDKEKWSKYKKDKRFIRFSACNGVELSKENPYFDRLKIMWNAGDRKKKCTAGILNSHMSIIKKIADNKINQSLIVEDDVTIDFDSLKKINLDKLPQDSLIYFGGVLHPPNSFKDKSWKYEEAKKSFKPGINRINPEKYRIFGGFGYYIPTWEIAKELYDIFSKKPKLKPLDTEMTYLQKKGLIKYFYYPAISYLHMDDANKGIHGNAYIKRDMHYYGGR